MYKVSEKPLNTGFFAFLWYNNGMVKETEIRDNLAKLNHDELLAYAIKAEIDKSINLDEIKEYAEKNLHMIYPEDSNILIYKGESNDYFRQYESVNSGK